MQTLADRVGRGGTGHSQDCQEDDLLGLTATPTYSDESRKGLLKAGLAEIALVHRFSRASWGVTGFLRQSFLPCPLDR